MSDPVRRLADDLTLMRNARARLGEFAARSADIDRQRRRQDEQLLNLRALEILRARTADPPLTWREIGEIFGVSPQRAQEMSRQGTYIDTTSTDRSITP